MAEEKVNLQSRASYCERQADNLADVLVSGFIFYGLIFIVGIFLAGVLIQVLALLGANPEEVRFPVLFTAFVPVLIGAIWRRRRKNQSSPSLQLDVDEIRLEVLHCTAQDAVLLEEYEDEGLGYFLDVGNGQILFLQGQYLYDLVWGDDWCEQDESRGVFPCTQFSLVRIPPSLGEPLDLQCSGQRFSPSRRITQNPDLSLPIPYDGTVFSGSLSTLEQDLRAAHEAGEVDDAWS